MKSIIAVFVLLGLAINAMATGRSPEPFFCFNDSYLGFDKINLAPYTPKTYSEPWILKQYEKEKDGIPNRWETI